MSHEAEIHQAQTQILRDLLFKPQAHFADLQRQTGLESDHFKFHLRRLVELEYIVKTNDKQYALSQKGKEYANKLDTDTNTIERQPKVSVVLILQRQNADGETEYLCQQRLKNPYFGFWGRLGGKLRWGESFEEAATRELKEETGLDGAFEYRMMFRKRDYRTGTKELLEDKIFLIMEARSFTGMLVEEFEGGLNRWMTQEVLKAQKKRFESAIQFVELLKQQVPYVQQDHFYAQDEY